MRSDADDWASASHMRTLVLMAATAIGVYLSYRMAAPFLPALAGAFGLAVVFMPLQRWLESKLKPLCRRFAQSVAAAIAVLAIAAIVVVPAIFVAQRLAIQALAGAELVQAKVESGEWQQTLAAQPLLAPVAKRIESELDLPGATRALTSWLSTSAGSLLKRSVLQIVGFALTFYLLFFFLRDRDTALSELSALSPLTRAEMDHLYQRVSDTVHATIFGTLAVAGVQGLLGGFMFWCLGLPAAFLWGLVMALLAVVPVLGSFIVWVPAALFLALEGSWGKALILALWGLLVVGTVDNLLRPVLVGSRLKQHTVLAFLSVVGGLLVFGASGLILGPLVLTLTLVLLEVWAKRGVMQQATDQPHFQRVESTVNSLTSI
jgi:predicted PurR-regulated permease PerM